MNHSSSPNTFLKPSITKWFERIKIVIIPGLVVSICEHNQQLLWKYSNNHFVYEDPIYLSSLYLIPPSLLNICPINPELIPCSNCNGFVLSKLQICQTSMTTNCTCFADGVQYFSIRNTGGLKITFVKAVDNRNSFCKCIC